MDYARWVEEQNRKLSELRSALNGHMSENELRSLVDAGMAHYDELFRLKGVAFKADVFHIISGMWKTPAERCFIWMGGFRPSELLKVYYSLIIFALIYIHHALIYLPPYRLWYTAHIQTYCMYATHYSNDVICLCMCIL